MKKGKTTQIECALYPVKVKFVTKRWLSKHIADPNEVVAGGYVSADNTIYISKELEPSYELHTLLHELKHAFDDQTQHMSEEDTADAFASMLIRLTSVKVSDIIK
jgi:Zn-dependent peptidase ImmA (M78 family)